jgi:hypothetical protein
MEENRGKYPLEVTETRTIHRITLHRIVQDILGAFNLERGLVYTCKLIFSRPGYMVRLYFGEGRFRIFNAFRFLILTTAVSLFLMYWVGLENMAAGMAEGYNNDEVTEQAEANALLLQTIIFDWYNLFLWISIPVYGFFSWLFNLKSGYNYAEHITFQCFYICAFNIIFIIGLILTLIFPSNLWVQVFYVLGLAYYLWMLAGWLEKKSFVFIIKNLLGFLLANFIYLILMMISIGIMILMKTGIPEGV